MGHPAEEQKTKVAGERFGFDVSSVKTRSIGGAKFWLLIVDHATDMSWSNFLKAKSEVPERMRQFVLDMRSQGFPVLFLRCDNAGENQATQSLFKEKNVHLKFEYTAPNTPQHNGKVERKFATFYGR
eukprot:scaffold16354_cov75-Cylindrotheca_fusiformis.AAC.1